MPDKDPITGGVIPSELGAKPAAAKPQAASTAQPKAEPKTAPTAAARPQVAPVQQAAAQKPIPPMPPQGGRLGPAPGAQPEHKNGSVAIILVLGAILFLGITLFLVVLNGLGAEENALTQAFGSSGVELVQFFFSITNILFGMAIVLSLLTFMIAIGTFFSGRKAGRPATGSKKTMIVSSVLTLLFMLGYAGAYAILSPKLQELQSTKQQARFEILATDIKTGQAAIRGAAPYEVEFTFSEPDELTSSYTWDFGDKSDLGRGYKTRHVFQKLGDFNVSLTIARGDGTSDVYTKRIIIENILAEVDIKASVTEGESPLEVFFDGSRSRDVGGDPLVKYVWDFDDTGSDQKTAEGQKASHVFYQPGSYDVRLTVTDSSGDESSDIVTINVESPDKKPRAAIETSPTRLQSAPPFKVDFNASGSYDPQGTSIVEYKWDFGDRSDIQFGKRISHTFTEVGSYDVKLTIQNRDGVTATKVTRVEVSAEQEGPTAKISPISKLTGDFPYTFEVSAQDSFDPDGRIVSYEWDFGDKTDVQYGEKTSHVYLKPGTYTARLTVTDDTDRVDSTTIDVNVVTPGKKAPNAILTASPYSGVVPLTVEFDATGSSDQDGELITYKWDFGDGTPPQFTSGKVRHRFENIGTYTIKLIVQDNDGLEDEATTTIAVNNILPTAQIKASTESGIAPMEIDFSAVESTGFLDEYRWDFGDGTIRYGVDVAHTYYEAGTYNVELTVTDNSKLTDSKTMTITVFDQ